MARVYNFNAGPAALPLAALEKAQKELLEYEDTGMSIMEHSHRGPAFDAVHNEAIALLKELYGVGDDYDVLLLQGGASLQFAMIPMNFIADGGSADYVDTGAWSKKAFEEANRIHKARWAASTRVDGKCASVPKQGDLDLASDAAYVHITTNNTIFGTQYHDVPDTGSVPLIADMSSDILWRPMDVSRFGMIYAGAQKNIGPSGLAVVFLNKTLLDKAREDVPNILSYRIHAKKNSLYNTPNTWGIYMVRTILSQVKEMGGLVEMEKRNRAKADKLYGAIDGAPDFFRSPVDKASRSVMNVVWRLPTEEQEKTFIAEAAKAGLMGLKGHRSVGGCRASIYNAVPAEGIDKLVEFMEEFRKRA